MSKLNQEHQFLDLSDYARPFAKILVKFLLPTPIGAITLTGCFTIIGSISIYHIFMGNFLIAAILLPIKSWIDAADGEIARARNKPSYVGRYLDSLCDFLINAGIFIAIAYSTTSNYSLALATWISMQLQGTLYNHYYLTRRHQTSGDTTSRLFEYKAPRPYPYDNKIALFILHKLYLLCYGWQDRLIQTIDSNITTPISNRFLTTISIFGLGFQLLVIAACLLINPTTVIPIFLVGFNSLALLTIILRDR